MALERSHGQLAACHFAAHIANVPEMTSGLASTAQHSTARHSTAHSTTIRLACSCELNMSLLRRHRLKSDDEPCQCICKAHLAQHPTQHRAAHAVGLVQIQLVGACITEPFPPRDTSYPVALLVHGHITVCAITQQDLIPASNPPTFCIETQLGMAKF